MMLPGNSEAINKAKHAQAHMDSVSVALYALKYRIAFLEKKGVEFQNWFAKLGNHALSTDFEEVRPDGKQGDWKCDGRQVSTGTIFQCYAPETPTARKTIDKINADFTGAIEKWPDFMEKWVFVHNVAGGQPPSVVSHLDTLRKAHQNILFEIWAENEIRIWHNMLDEDGLLSMYGHVPTQQTVSGLELEDLKPIIDALAQIDPDPSDPLPPPPSENKLEKNALSPEAADLLRLGRRKVRLVEDYFGKVEAADIGEKIAQSFRHRYAELDTMGLEPDRIFTYLQEFAGMTGSPKRQAAAMAVLAYFFDRCDIFDDPEDQAAIS